jgi:peptidoglycan/xylan/chitin deacetylase (PgdA/CDA1 family)
MRAADRRLLLGLGLLLLLLPSPSAAQQAREISVSDEEIVRGDPSRPNLALVFNIGAGYEPATAILDALAERDQRATFFVMGWWAEQHPDVLRQVAAADQHRGGRGRGHRQPPRRGLYVDDDFGAAYSRITDALTCP